MRARAAAFLLILAALPACNPPGTPVAAPSVDASLSFKGMWWSKSQMEGLNPNSPPPKTQAVDLERWEYTDPIGVPHPDTVDVVLSVSNRNGFPAEQIRLWTIGRWKAGPQSEPEKAAWDPKNFIDDRQTLTLQSGETREVRTPVDLAQKMNQLSRSGWWPWELSITVTITDSTNSQILAKVEKSLPIRPGD